MLLLRLGHGPSDSGLQTIRVATEGTAERYTLVIGDQIDDNKVKFLFDIFWIIGIPRQLKEKKGILTRLQPNKWCRTRSITADWTLGLVCHNRALRNPYKFFLAIAGSAQTSTALSSRERRSHAAQSPNLSIRNKHAFIQNDRWRQMATFPRPRCIRWCAQPGTGKNGETKQEVVRTQEDSEVSAPAITPAGCSSRQGWPVVRVEEHGVSASIHE